MSGRIEKATDLRGCARRQRQRQGQITTVTEAEENIEKRGTNARACRHVREACARNSDVAHKVLHPYTCTHACMFTHTAPTQPATHDEQTRALTDMCIQLRNVRSFAKCTFGSTFDMLPLTTARANRLHETSCFCCLASMMWTILGA